MAGLDDAATSGLSIIRRSLHWLIFKLNSILQCLVYYLVSALALSDNDLFFKEVLGIQPEKTTPDSDLNLAYELYPTTILSVYFK